MDCVIPIIIKVETKLQDDFVTSLQLCKNNLTRITKTLKNLKTFVTKYEGKAGTLKSLASKYTGGLVAKLNKNEVEAGQFIVSNFQSMSPEQLFDKLAGRLEASVGQLNLAISAQLLTGGGGNFDPSACFPIPESMKKVTANTTKLEVTQTTAPEVKNIQKEGSEEINPLQKDPSIGEEMIDSDAVLMVVSGATDPPQDVNSMDRAKNNYSLLELIAEDMKDAEDIAMIYLPPISDAEDKKTKKVSNVSRYYLIKIHQKYFMLSVNRLQIHVSSVPSLEAGCEKAEWYMRNKLKAQTIMVAQTGALLTFNAAASVFFCGYPAVFFLCCLANRSFHYGLYLPCCFAPCCLISPKSQGFVYANTGCCRWARIYYVKGEVYINGQKID